MAWQEQDIRPNRRGDGSRPLPPASPALSRLLGSLGFCAVGLSTLYAGAAILGVDPDLSALRTWSLSVVGLAVVSGIAGLLGGLFGLFIGAGIPVRRARADHAISVVWHYLANGGIVSFFLWGLVLTKLIGSGDDVARFADGFGRWRLTWITVGADVAMATTLAVVLLLAGLLPPRQRPRLAGALLVAVPLALIKSRYQFVACGFDSGLWLFLGAVWPLGTIIVSAYMIQRDAGARVLLAPGSGQTPGEV